MTERSLFRIYSMTRPVTAVAVMMLHEEGRFELDDPVARFIPEFKNVVVAGDQGARPRPAMKPMTVRDLLLHTSGLNARTSEIYRREQVRSRTITMAQFIANLVRVPLMEEPGTRYRYSEGTTVLGRLVEIWSGKLFEEFLAERIFRPLRMTDTMFWASTADERARLTTVYGPAQGGGLVQVETETLPFTEHPTLVEGAVGLLSTVPDYLRFSQMLLNKGELDGVRLLRAQTVDTMTTNGLSEAVQKTRGGSMGWGLANVQVLLEASASDPASKGEYGWDGTAGTIFWVDPLKQTVTVLMTQSSPRIPIRFASASRRSCSRPSLINRQRHHPVGGLQACRPRTRRGHAHLSLRDRIILATERVQRCNLLRRNLELDVVLRHRRRFTTAVCL